MTGICDGGYGLCVVQGQWRGSYVNGKPCIVNPDNVQTNSPPPLPSPPPSPKPLLPSSEIICDDEKPCKVIVGANKLARVSKGFEDLGMVVTVDTVPLNLGHSLLSAVPYHAYLLVVDPNNTPRDGFDAPAIFQEHIGGLVGPDDKSTVYYFGAFSERAAELRFPKLTPQSFYNGLFGGRIEGESYFGNLITKMGLYNDRADDYVDQIKASHLQPRYELISQDSKCDDVLRCLKDMFNYYNGQFGYGAFAVNSNFVTSNTLRICGLPYSHPPGNVMAPGWYNK